MNATSLADIQSVDWSLKLGAIGEVVQGLADVDQCIAIILTTPKGSDVLRPTFGADLWRFVDNPITAAIPGIVREVRAAITAWEPRVTIVSVTAALAPQGEAQAIANLQVSVTWQLNLGGTRLPARQTTVTIGGGV